MMETPHEADLDEDESTATATAAVITDDGSDRSTIIRDLMEKLSSSLEDNSTSSSAFVGGQNRHQQQLEEVLSLTLCWGITMSRTPLRHVPMTIP